MNNLPDESVQELANHLFREHYGKMVSFLSHKYGYSEIENILDAVQEAFEAALNTWKYSGIPDKPFAWLYKVASHKLLNKLRKLRQENTDRKYQQGQLALHEGTEEHYSEKEVEDSLLKLLVFFSKIELSERNKLIVSLYFLCGFGYAEISSALLLKMETVKKVVLRSKKDIRQFSSGYESFHTDTLDENTGHLLRILYLLFNEGYKTSQKKGAIHYDLCYEAIRLGKLIQRHNPANPEVNALLALFFFNTSRFPARIQNGSWVSLEEQDRSLWHQGLISEGFYYLNRVRDSQQTLSRYYLEALISSIHCTAVSYEKTNWEQVAFLYRQLEQIAPESVSITFNRIIAESNYKDIPSLLVELNGMEKLVSEETAFAWYTSKAYLYLRLQEWQQAEENYRQSLHYTKNKTDIFYINGKLDQIKKSRI